MAILGLLIEIYFIAFGPQTLLTEHDKIKLSLLELIDENVLVDVNVWRNVTFSHKFNTFFKLIIFLQIDGNLVASNASFEFKNSHFSTV